MALWDSMHGDEGKSVAMDAGVSHLIMTNTSFTVARRFTLEISREEKGKHQVQGLVELGSSYRGRLDSPTWRADGFRVGRTILLQGVEKNGDKGWSLSEIPAMVKPRSHCRLGISFGEPQAMVEPYFHDGQGTPLLLMVVDLYPSGRLRIDPPVLQFDGDRTETEESPARVEPRSHTKGQGGLSEENPALVELSSHAGDDETQSCPQLAVQRTDGQIETRGVTEGREEAQSAKQGRSVHDGEYLLHGLREC